MPKLIENPTLIQAAGTKPKQIQEFAGRVNSGRESVSVARMVSPEGWVEPVVCLPFRRTRCIATSEPRPG